jgi:isopentenyl-diphosphate delta-isomerase
MIEEVVLVDVDDNPIGLMEKMQAHREAKLHRAFSVFLFNDNNELLLQQRSAEKYHCANLWTNTCCSHPRDGEELDAAVARRLDEELGLAAVVDWKYSFIYKADVGAGLFEHELDHVFFGKFNGVPQPNSKEVADWKFVNLESLRLNLAKHSELYTPWFKIIMAEVDKKLL